MKKRQKPELLMPAGGIEPFIAAVENGADAIYVGGRAFNARMNANNFDDETLQYALDYAHKRGVKVHVTMNTLLKDDELDAAMEYARFLYQAGVDALIIQDLGLAKRIGEEMPDFPRHLSTQGTCYDLEGVRLAKELGFERVVLSRELFLAEITEICDAEVADIEAFIHGALCICYSGQCQMSRYYGGRSGNRGACAQPCRLPYNGRDENGKKMNGHLLSPRDLCTIDHIGDLIDAGVLSFKIEGRMKQPEYVGIVTGIYRKYIDEHLAHGHYTVSEQDRLALEQIFNRGGFTEGYLYENPGEDLMSPYIPKNQGLRIGTVASVKKGSALVDIRAVIEPEIGDGIEIRGASGKAVSNIMTYKKELAGGLIRIGDFKEEVNKGDWVYRTSSKSQLDASRQTFRGIDIADNGENRTIGRRRPIEMTLTSFGGMLELSASTKAEKAWASQRSVRVTVQAGPFEADYERPTPKERYEASLSKTGSTPFEVTRIRMKGDFDLRVKASAINALRRECLAKLEEEMTFRRKLPAIQLPVIGLETMDMTTAGEDARTEYFFHTLAAWEARQGRIEADPQSIRVLLPLAELCQLADREGRGLAAAYHEQTLNGTFDVVPYITNVTLGLEDQILEAHMCEIEDFCMQTGIYVGNLGWLRRLAVAGIPVMADYGLNIFNSETGAALHSMGVTAGTLSLEADEDQSEHGAFPLMVSRHPFQVQELRNDRRNIRAEVVRRPYSDQSLIVADAEANEQAGGTRLYFWR